jgi:hypothetical protein
MSECEFCGNVVQINSVILCNTCLIKLYANDSGDIVEYDEYKEEEE